MRYTVALIATLFTLAAASGTAFAQRGHGNGQGPKGASPHPPTHTTGKPAGTPSGAPATPQGHGGGNPHKAPTTAATTTTTTTTTTTVSSTTPTSTFVKNPQLEQRLQTLLPGMNLADASKGFKNWGQFVAAAHVSNNLNIPFTSLKAKMTGPSPMSLGQAIQALKPAGTTTTVTTSTVQTEVRRAETETDEDFRVARDDRRR